MKDSQLIAQFCIFAQGHRISFKSDKTVAMQICDFFVKQIGQPDTIVSRVHIDHSCHPEVKTFISCKGQASIDQLLSIPQIRTIFLRYATP